MENSNLGNSKGGFERFVKYIEKSYKPWYNKIVHRSLILWYVCQFLSVLCGFATALLAAFVDEDYFANFGKILLVIIPLIGSLAATVILQFRFFDLWQLRETGRIAIEKMISKEYQLLASNKLDLDYSKLHDKFIQKLYKIEETQGTQFFQLSSASSVMKFEKRE